MEEDASHGYMQFGKKRGRSDFKFSNGYTRVSPPVDKRNLIYNALILGGLGFLLPYNSFIIAVDYFQAKYPGTAVVFDISSVYITVAFFAAFTSNVLVETLSLNTRITFGYAVSFITLNFVVICEIWWEFFGVATSYTINLVAVAIVSFGCTVQQSSFYGYASMLPRQYTHAVMMGESLAGVLVSIDRMLTKSALDDERGNTCIFFATSNLMILMCFILHEIVRKSDFVQFYITLCHEKNRISLEPTEDAGLMDPMDQTVDPSKGQYGVLKIQISPPGNDTAGECADLNASTTDPVATEECSSFSFSNPVYEPGAPSVNPSGTTGPTYKVEDIVVMRGTYGNQSSKRWSGIKKGLAARMEVAKLIYPYMYSIGTAYFVTLSLYPGIVSEIVSCKFESWMPVILMTAFNISDLLGKMLAAINYEWKRTQLVYFSNARIIFIFMFPFCVLPRGAPILAGEIYPLIFSALLGLTNGIVGSVPMIQAPSKVPEEHRELAGNIMTLSYTTGLTFGSFMAYVIDAYLGPSAPLKKVCPKLLQPLATSFSNTTSSILSVMSSTLPSIEMYTGSSNVSSTAATVVSTVLTSTLVSNSTSTMFSTGLADTSTTILPRVWANATAPINAAI